MKAYFHRMRGGGPLPPRLPARNIVRGFTGALIAVGAGYLTAASGVPLVLGSFGASFIDMNFHAAGAEICAAIETNSLITLWSHIRFGHWSTVVPNTFLLLLRQLEGVIALPLVKPESSHVLGLVVPDREPIPPLARELLEVAKRSIFRPESRNTRQGGDRSRAALRSGSAERGRFSRYRM